MTSVYSHNLKLEIFGASHDAEIGMSLSGIPAGLKIDTAKLQDFLSRRAPGTFARAAQGRAAQGRTAQGYDASDLTTSRREEDKAIFTSGLDSAGFTTGETITAIIKNTDVRDSDYDGLRYIPRPNHADYTTKVKYGLEADTAGGGHNSGRMSAPLCVAGNICLQILEAEGVTFNSRIDEIGGVEDELDRINLVREMQADNNSVGGIISLEVNGLNAGIGSPMFYGMENLISELMFAVPGVKGVEFGAGFDFARMDGFSANDEFAIEDGRVVTTSNNCGGILGGITSGMPLTLRVAFKPTPSIGRLQRSVNLKTMEPVALRIEGRHDPCIVLRARPCVEAAAAIAIVDAILGDEPGGAPGKEIAKPTSGAPGKEIAKPTSDAPGEEIAKPTGSVTGCEATKPTSGALGCEATKPTGGAPGEEIAKATSSVPGCETTKPTGSVPGDKISTEKAQDEGANLSLTSLRLEVDDIDEEMIKLFERRMDVCKKIGDYKKTHNLATKDEKREKEKLKKVKKSSRDDLKKYTKDLYKEIFELSKKYQKK